MNNNFFDYFMNFVSSNSMDAIINDYISGRITKDEYIRKLKELGGNNECKYKKNI